MTGTELLQTWTRRVWLDGDISAIRELFAPEAEAGGLMDIGMKVEDFEVIVPAFLTMLDDLDVSLLRLIEQDDWIAALLNIQGRAAITGAPVRFTGQLMLRHEDGKFVEAYNNFDLIALFEQLELMPRDTLAICLTGDAICPPA